MFPLDVIAYSGARYGEGSGPVYLDSVNCLGNESRLIECTYASSSTCPHSQDAGVQCRAECKNSLSLLLTNTTTFTTPICSAVQ